MLSICRISLPKIFNELEIMFIYIFQLMTLLNICTRIDFNNKNRLP